MARRRSLVAMPSFSRGAALLITGLLLFACMDATTKFLAIRFEVPAIVAFRYAGNLLLLTAFVAPTQGRALVRTARTGLVVLRALCLASASLLIGLAFQRLPVAETTAINLLAPMLVVIAAGPLLRETIGAAGWVAALLGLVGVLLIVRPGGAGGVLGGGLEPVGVLCALGAVVANTGYQLLSRVLAATERTAALLFYAALTGTILFGAALPWFWGGRMPTAAEALLLGSLGVYSGLGHFLFTTAYAHAHASRLAPLLYIQLILAGLLGWLVFGAVPDALALTGMGVIAASGVLASRAGRGSTHDTA